MSKIIEREAYAYGVLYVGKRSWKMLDPEPQKNSLPFYLRNDAYRFHIVDDSGNDAYADVHGDFVVIAYPEIVPVTVKIVVDDDIESGME